MSALENLKKNKKALVGIILILILIAAYFIVKSSQQQAPTEEVISKRVKLEVKQTPEPTEAAAPAGDAATPTESASAAATQAPPDIKPVQPAIEVVKPIAESKAVRQAPKAEDKKPAAIIDEKKAQAPRAEVKEEIKEVKKTVKTAAAKKDAKAGKKTKKAEKSRAVKAVSAKELASKPWAVNVASFPVLVEAQSLTSSLKSMHYNAYITEFTKDETKWYRVRVGFFSQEKEALKAGNKIADKFKVQSPWIVKPARNEASAHFK